MAETLEADRQRTQKTTVPVHSRPKKESIRSITSYVVKAEALRALGNIPVGSTQAFLRDALTVVSPRDVVRRAAEWALAQL